MVEVVVVVGYSNSNNIYDEACGVCGVFDAQSTVFLRRIWGLRIMEGRPWVQGWSKMAAEVTEKSLSDKPIFLCSSCGFECHYEYFGKKPPCSKSVM